MLIILIVINIKKNIFGKMQNIGLGEVFIRREEIQQQEISIISEKTLGTPTFS